MPDDIIGHATAASEKDERGSVRLSPAARAVLDEIMARTGITTIQEAVRRSLGDELFLLKQRNEGWKVVLQNGERYREIVWPE
jgi:hypothetical protein